MDATARHSAPLSFISFAGIAILVASLTACSTPEPAPTTSTTTTPSAVASAQPEATDEPTVPTETTANCDTALNAEGMASLANDGLTLRAPSALGPVMQAMVDDGGLSCHWQKPGSDIELYFAQLSLSDGEWDARRVALLEAGFTETSDPLPGTLLAPADYDSNMQPVITYGDGTMYFVSSASQLTKASGLQ